jgi:Flp pilus assembly protein TadG
MTRDRGSEGSLTVFVAVLAVALFAIAGLAVDGGRALAAREQASAEAEQAARAGAQAVSVSALRQGRVVLDPAVAVADADAYLHQIGAHGSATATATMVTVTVDAGVQTTILGVIGIRRLAVRATASASDQHGVSEED